MLTKKKDFDNSMAPIKAAITSRNQPKCNQSIYDYMQLIVCD
jgi:hypothetical protein